MGQELEIEYDKGMLPRNGNPGGGASSPPPFRDSLFWARLEKPSRPRHSVCHTYLMISGYGAAIGIVNPPQLEISELPASRIPSHERDGLPGFCDTPWLPGETDASILQQPMHAMPTRPAPQGLLMGGVACQESFLGGTRGGFPSPSRIGNLGG